MKSEFDFEQAVKDLMNGKPLTGQDGILMPLIKKLTETVLTAELDAHRG